MDNKSGVLSLVLNAIAEAGANILTINQTIPINGVANVTVTVETRELTMDMAEFVEKIEDIDGVRSLDIIARE